MKYRTKTFEENRLFRRPAGAAPGVWEVLGASTPLDILINRWCDETGAVPISTSPPGIDIRWMDTEMTVRSIMIVVVLIYYIEEGNLGRHPTETARLDEPNTRADSGPTGRTPAVRRARHDRQVEPDRPIDAGVAPYPDDAAGTNCSSAATVATDSRAGGQGQSGPADGEPQGDGSPAVAGIASEAGGPDGP